MSFGMDTDAGNMVVYNILQSIKQNKLTDRDALKFLYDHLSHLSDSTFYRESNDSQVKKLAIEWLEQEKIIKPRLAEFVTI